MRLEKITYLELKWIRLLPVYILAESNNFSHNQDMYVNNLESFVNGVFFFEMTLYKTIHLSSKKCHLSKLIIFNECGKNSNKA